MAVPKPMQTEFGIHHRLESCATFFTSALHMLCTLFKMGQCNVKKLNKNYCYGALSRYIWSRWMMRSHRKHKLNILSLSLQFLRRGHTPNGRLSPSGESPPLPPPLTSTAPVTYIGLHEDQDLTVGVFTINPGANVRRLFPLFYRLTFVAG